MIKEEAVIYTRVSSAKQVTHGSGLQTQEFSCRRYAEENKIKVLKVFSDEGVSGGTTFRPSLNELIDFLKQRKKKTYIIIYDLSRISRDNYGYYLLKEKFAELNGKLVSVTDNFDDSAQGEFIEGMKVTVNTFYRKSNNEHLMRKMRDRLREGYWVFRSPVGYKSLNKLLVEDESNSKFIKKIYEDFADGRYLTYKQIKDSADAQNLINIYNRPYKLKDDFIKNLLTNNLYRGIIHYPKWDINYVQALHKGFISNDLFDAVQIQLKKKRLKNTPTWE